MKSKLLPAKLPRTIEDSIKAILLLGYQYLWIDAFCIQQDNAADRHLQIQQMDLIYTSAELTLIAAAGDDFSFGLPGVCSKRRVRYRDAVVGNMCVAYVLTNVFQSIARSRWFTRGWTFQEGYLPPRRLYFTDSAVLFICNLMQGHEGFQRYPSESEVYRVGGTLNSQVLGPRSDGHSGPSEVMRSLEQYSACKLSYDYDALNAIRGALNYHRSKKQSTETMWDKPH
ncbi:heterokaryon incompatibility protein-domain-containing protein [Alternaria rosae]|uniref:heterokaryon incompatibility protein-domain-containing protein n=1 Tax=Alternaria rosae TaxID=1187941 RepID=UPI001E8E29CA|nr:heterokaryon incompatibility protein-domain-containing protein [Alternaria rosae]KAH6866392.1 heterokaryon incompatibility protein-domain-containing protein [Alternaria rosae]